MIEGKFLADFESFYTACAKAEISLKAFDSGAGKVETSLNKMADSFSGRKIVQEATLMAKVFQDAGGAAAFTESELARMGSVGAEAAEKLRVLGKDVPAGIQKIAAEARVATTAHAPCAARSRNWRLSSRRCSPWSVASSFSRASSSRRPP
jgi:hypothetical protein